jgi:hypothetical protein
MARERDEDEPSVDVALVKSPPVGASSASYTMREVTTSVWCISGDPLKNTVLDNLSFLAFPTVFSRLTSTVPDTRLEDHPEAVQPHRLSRLDGRTLRTF